MNIAKFLKEAKVELQKVNWPGPKQVREYTIAVIIISLVTALFLGALDIVFSKIVETYFLSV
jgi:preprotein translocase subunit SecE